MENEKNIPNCCKPKQSKGIWQGILYGTIPHIGCIAFILAAVLGSTVLLQFFKPLLMNKYIFYYLVLISIGFATASSFFYLKKHKSLSWNGIKSKKGYLSIMYGSVVGINILLFFLVFPMLANIGGVSAEEANKLSMLKIKVNIPCPGHAPLISSELNTVRGVKGTEYSFPNNFEVYYDSSLTSKQKMLSLKVFDEYPATILEEKTNTNYQQPEETSKSYQSCCGGAGCGSAQTGVCSCGG